MTVGVSMVRASPALAPSPADALLREALGVADHASCIINARGEIVFNNRAFEELTGYSSSELAAGGYMLLRDEGSPPEVYRELWRTVRSGQVWRGRLPYRRKDGRAHPCSVVVTPFGEAERGPAYFYVTQLDITEQIAREEERRRTREQLEREVRLRSEELEKLYSISAALHTSLDLEETLRTVLVAVTAGEGYRFNRAFLFLLEHGDPGYLVGRMAVGPFDAEEAANIWRAITAVGPRTERLSDVVRRFSAQIEDAEEGLTRVVRELRIPLDRTRCPVVRAVLEKQAVQMDEAAAGTGFSCDGIAPLKCHAFAVVPLIYREEAEGCILVDNAITRKAITSEEIRTLELFADHAAHAIANAMLYQRAQDLLDERNKALEELRSNQERLVDAEKLAALGRMAAIVVHELRTPLAVIGGYARNLLKHLTEESPLQEDLRIVRDEVSRLEDVVERLLFYARPKEPLCKPGNLNSSITRLLDYLAEPMEHHGIHADKDLDPCLPDFRFDERQIRQVLLNLVTNAIQAMPEGGTLRIVSRKEDESICMTVADTGEGIPPESLPHLFEPFHTTKPKGTGLGLHVAQRIVEGHGGEIHVENAPEGGAVFTVRLPLQPEDQVSAV